MKQVYSMVGSMLLLCCSLFSQAQQAAVASANAVVPPLVKFSGTLNDATGKPLSGVVGVTFALYQEEQGGAPLWIETQNVTADKNGHYTVMLGSTTSTGLPADIFVAGEARWIAVQPEGQSESSRVLLLSVPYALKAGDAQTLGGLPASAFMLAGPVAGVASSAAAAGTSVNSAGSLTPTTSSGVTTSGGTVNALPLFSTATNIQNSLITQTGTAAINVGGKLNLFATGTATAAGGKNSQAQSFVASVFNSSTSTAVAQTFQLQAESAGNDTSAASGTLNLLYASGTAAPAETGLKISSKGLITFASGQTFPGSAVGTITGVTAGTDLTGGGTSGIVTLNVDTTKVPQLGANNTFSGTQIISGSSASGLLQVTNTDTAGLPSAIIGTTPAVGGVGISGVATSTASSDANAVGVRGTSASPTGVGVSGVSPNLGVYGASTGTASTSYGVMGNSGIVGVFGNSTGNTGSGVEGTSPNVGVLGNGTGAGGIGLDGHGTFQGAKGISTATTGSAQGVYGQSASSAGYGVEGASPYIGVSGSGATAGVNGTSSANGGYGVIGSVTGSSIAAGVLGSSASSTGFGVYGQVNSGAGSTAGVFGSNVSGNGYGVQGTAPNIGVYGTATSTSAYGVEGTSPNVGVFGDGTGTGGIGVDGHGTTLGVRAIATETTGASIGAYGQSSSASGFGVKGAGPNVGVYGSSSGTSATGSGVGNAGIWGDTGGKSGDGYYGVLGTADSNSAGGFFNNSETYPTLYAVDNAADEGIILGPNPPVIESYAPSFGALCAFYALGSQDCSATSSTSAPVDNGTRRVSLYSVQSPNVWFEDAGSGQLSSGSTTVTLDPTFAQTVNTGVEYHVFLTPNGDCKGLYVTRKTATTFEVHELGGGTSSIAFDYRVMAKRAGYENKRMEDVTDRYRAAAKLAQARGVQRPSAAAANAPVHIEAPPVALTHK
jgi:hypothetical protein